MTRHLFGGDERAQVGTIITVVALAVTAVVGLLIFSQLFAVVPASDTTTIENETFDGSFGADDQFDYTVAEPEDGNFESFNDDETVLNGSDAELTEGTDYEWFTGNQTVRVFNTSATWSGTSDTSETLKITYSFDEKPTGSYSILSGFGDSMQLVPVVLIVLVAGLVIGVVQRFG